MNKTELEKAEVERRRRNEQEEEDRKRKQREQDSWNNSVLNPTSPIGIAVDIYGIYS